jgi:hypothetical protein
MSDKDNEMIGRTNTVDGVLQALATTGGDPWLARRVETELAARAQARQWLKAHPQGVVSLRALFPADLLNRRSAGHAGLIFAAAIFGAAAIALPALAAHVGVPLAAMTATSLAAALAAAAALRWNDLRGAFTV